MLLGAGWRKSSDSLTHILIPVEREKVSECGLRRDSLSVCMALGRYFH